METSKRIVFLDALRGYALFGIIILHCITHFNIFGNNSLSPDALHKADEWVFYISILLFDSKCYSLFALLLGYSFWLQYERKLKLDIDYGYRYLWRLFLLLIIGLLHSAFYSGDMLVIYAITGTVVVFTRKLSNRAILGIAITLLLDPIAVTRIVGITYFDSVIIPKINVWRIFQPAMQILMEGSFLEVIQTNMTSGIVANNAFNFEVGRVTQTPGLFLVGVWLSRKKVLVEFCKELWLKRFLFSLATFILLNYLKPFLIGHIDNEIVQTLFDSSFSGYIHLVGTLAVLSILIIIWHYKIPNQILSKLAVYGRMSLTNYFSQGVIGALVYYGFGLGLYIYSGAAISLIIALIIFIAQYLFSKWYLSNHKQGPMEFVWRKLTNL